MTDILSATNPELLRSRDGFQFDPTSLKWQLSRDNIIYLSWVNDFLSPRFKLNFLCILSHYAHKYSAAHTSNISDRFREFSRFLHSNRGLIDRISSDDLINYRATLDREHEWYLGSIRGFLKTWMALTYSGVDDEVESLLDGWKIRGNIKGLAVQVLCPKKGPLSDFEFEALHQALVDKFELGRIDIDTFVLVELFLATGRRPVQIGDLKAKDLIEAHSKDGLREFVLNVPRRKRRGIAWRQDFKPFALVPEVGLAVRGLIEKNNRRMHSLSSNLPWQTLAELPLFPSWNVIENAFTGKNPINIDALLGTEQCHRTTNNLRTWLEEAVSLLEIPSERTGQHLRIFPTRLRRTLATRAAREGFGELIIAELLDHTDTQNARIYTENVPEHVDAINKAVARQLAPLAQAFAGALVDQEGEAIRGGDLSSRIRCESGNVGTCGHHGFCGAFAPIACYTCRSFQPWLDGPHEEILDALLAERERVMRITEDKTIAAINDRTILAVTQVIQHCEARREELNQGGRRLG